jgi:hypothetical protein
MIGRALRGASELGDLLVGQRLVGIATRDLVGAAAIASALAPSLRPVMRQVCGSTT